jgi:hydroxyethylthiazole kinase
MSVSSLKKAVVHAFDAIRRKKPIIYQIMNHAMMNQAGNVTIYVGAKPIMAYTVEEVEEMASQANALVIDSSTLSESWVHGMHLAGQRANNKEIPIIFDPVLVGATTYRTETILKLLNSLDITILKGNSSEIRHIYNASVNVHGTESDSGVLDSSQMVRQLAQKRNRKTVVAVTGQKDYVSDGHRIVIIKNHCERLNQLTGMGCIVNALMACFASVTNDYLVAAVGGLSVMDVCAEQASISTSVHGTASFQMVLFDRLSTLTSIELESFMHIDIIDH